MGVEVSAMRRRTGTMERPQQRHGPVSRVTPAVEGRVRELVRARSDVALAELQQQLQRDPGMYLSIGLRGPRRGVLCESESLGAHGISATTGRGFIVIGWKGITTQPGELQT
jgi:hypothetical protein